MLFNSEKSKSLSKALKDANTVAESTVLLVVHIIELFLDEPEDLQLNNQSISISY